MGEFCMPSLGADMDAGTLVEWLKAPGDQVHSGDVIAVVETQKGAIEVEAFEDGILGEPLVKLGTKVPVGTPLAMIASAAAPGDTGPARPAAAPPAAGPSPPPAAVPSPAPPRPAAVAAAAARRVSPAARKRAAELGVPLAGIEGTGPEGAVVIGDVERQATQSAPQKKRPGIDPLEMRQAIAAAMSRSKREIPHYYLTHAIDVGVAQEWLAATNAGREPAQRIVLAALLIKAVARSVSRFPEFNGFYEKQAFTPSTSVHVGMAISLRTGGLVAPAIRDTDKKGMDELMKGLRDLTARTRQGRLRSSELFEATITVSSLGDRGVDGLIPVIYPPQVAIIGFGSPQVQPRVLDGAITARPTIMTTLAADHRANDGHRGALFLLEIANLLQNPAAL